MTDIDIGTIAAVVDGVLIACSHADPDDPDSHRIFRQQSARYVAMARQDRPAPGAGTELWHRTLRLVRGQGDVPLAGWPEHGPRRATARARGWRIILPTFAPDDAIYPCSFSPASFSLILRDFDTAYDGLIDGRLALSGFQYGVMRGAFSGVLIDRSLHGRRITVRDGRFAIRLHRAQAA